MKRVLFSRWLLSFVGTALLAAIVWVFGPWLAALEPVVARAAVVAAMLLAWLAANLMTDWRRRRREAALVQGVAVPADPNAIASAEEAAALQDKLAGAMALLQKARGTRGYLYEQPWYAIIGPPGAGKTTALLNAGLQFPLAAEMGQGAVAGVGGTRLCDWWFTDQAVLIDTAGRYTTQDSAAEVDRAGWEAFLGLLKRTRTRQPLNGVIVAIALSDVAQAPKDERLAHARAIRRRLKELGERLGVRLPVYALFTKADLVAGFTEFFDDLDREKRAQVWGMTFPLAQPEAGPAAKFGDEFRLLVERLNARLLERLQGERSPDRRALIAGFPAQVASLEGPAAEFLQEAFGGSRLDPAPFLRGVYLTSGTQEGTPIDRLTGTLARAFGLDQRRAPALRPEQGRSYFLGRLLRDVVFGEAMLVSERPGAARRRWLVQAGSLGLALLAALVCGAALLNARASGEREIGRTETALAAYRQTAAGLPLDPVAEADLPRIAPLLDQARDLPHGYAATGHDAGSWLSFGLSQDAKLAAGARAVYRHALERVLLPRMVWQLEAEMRGNLNQPDLLYEETRVYLMLGGAAGHFDRDLIREWMHVDWARLYPDPVQAPLRQDLEQHLDALLVQPLPQMPLDGALVATARATFSHVSLAQRVYSLIKPSGLAQAVPPWRPAEPLGPAGARVFVRASGKPLTDGIPGFLTVPGFHGVLLTQLAAAVKQVASESWVLGERSQIDPNSPQVQTLEHDVVALYEADYRAAWDALLKDLEVVPLRSVGQAAVDLNLLSSPQSPMRDLLVSVARQLTLSQAPAAPVAAAGGATQAVAATEARLRGLLGAQAPGQAPPPPPGSEIDAYYKPLRDFVGTGPGAPMDAALKSMNDLQQQLAKLSQAMPGGPPPAPTGDDPATALRTVALQAPAPVSRWLQAIAVSGTVLRGGGAKEQAKAAFNGAGGPAALCQKAVAGRYPFTPGSPNAIPLDDFTRLFAPGGLLDGFFNTQLRPYVDTSRHPWRAQAVDGVPPPVGPADLAAFQRAADIRDLFFAAGGTTPTVRFSITPGELDPGAHQVTLDLGGTEVVNNHGPPRSTAITWPGPNGMDTVRLVFDPPPASTSGTLSATGPWALFRLIDMGKLQRGGSADLYQLSFDVGDRHASFDLRAGSVLNPFAPGLLAGFRCPALQ